MFSVSAGHSYTILTAYNISSDNTLACIIHTIADFYLWLFEVPITSFQNSTLTKYISIAHSMILTVSVLLAIHSVINL